MVLCTRLPQKFAANAVASRQARRVVNTPQNKLRNTIAMLITSVKALTITLHLLKKF